MLIAFQWSVSRCIYDLDFLEIFGKHLFYVSDMQTYF